MEKITENELLEFNRNLMKKWNDKRRQRESKELEKFYSLRRLFHPAPKNNSITALNQPR
jgi:hypothetical protein